MSGRLTITIDAALCVRSGTCIYLAPNTFRKDAEGRTEVVDPSPDSNELILEAAANCPMEAIIVSSEGDET